MVLLSFIIPAYNCEQYIASCFKSVSQCGLKQDEYEIIFVNDASTDNTLSVCRQLAKKYTHIHVINQAKGGPATARNNGLKAAIGEYIWFVDADDTITCGFAKQLMPYMLKEHEVVGFNYQKVYATENVPYLNFKDVWQCTGREYLEKMYHGLYLWDKIFKRTAITEKFMDDTYHIEDFYFDYVNIVKMTHVICIPQVGYHYIQSKADSISKRRDLASVSKANEDAFLVYRELHRHWQNESNEKVKGLLSLILSHGLAGHFFTMMNESPVDMIVHYIDRYKSIGLYPVAYTDEKRKNLFLKLVNIKQLFLLFIYVYNFLKK